MDKKMKTIKQRREKVGTEYLASGYGRGTNCRPVYLIDGFYYAYHPQYAEQLFEELPVEFKGYIPVNKSKVGDNAFFYQCGANLEGYNRHIPA
jgi:hypothetical protein